MKSKDAMIYELRIGEHKFFAYPSNVVGVENQENMGNVDEQEQMGFLKGCANGPVAVIKVDGGKGYVIENGKWNEVPTKRVKLEEVSRWKG